MKLTCIKIAIISLLIVANSCTTKQSDVSEKIHPRLIMQKSAVAELIAGINKYPQIKAGFDDEKRVADRAIELGIIVPVPRDESGGYTHSQHSSNYKAMYCAGEVYQLTGEIKYAIFVRDMLIAYAKLYPTLPSHPMAKVQAAGKIFWQGLNDSVWLLNVIQAYDNIYDFLSEAERIDIETNLFEGIVNFFTVEDSYSFDRIHNHGTWTVAGIGMAGLVMDRPEWVDMALYGTKRDSTAGLMKQIDQLFSPDGYYTEGPNYQRYATTPFLVFAQALENNRPELKIFQYKDSVLIKSVSMMLQLADANGDLFPLNDALKRSTRSNSRKSSEMLVASNIIFPQTKDPYLLGIAKGNQKVMLSRQGLDIVQTSLPGSVESLAKKSFVIHDGPEGKDGGLAIMRAGTDKDGGQSEMVMKFSTHGMVHGNFDKLSFSLYDDGEEIVPDYGAVRFSNATVKFGGRYLDENVTWAQQTIAHNTMLLNEKSNFNGDMAEAAKYHSDFLFHNVGNDSFQIVAAVDSNCYEGATLQRTMALVNNVHGRFLIDLFRVESQDEEVTCDLPLYYKGQMMSANFKYKKSMADMKALGTDNGYQYLWVEAYANKFDKLASICWMNENREFYTWTFQPDENSEFYFTFLGANDPDFNLTREAGLMIRQRGVKKHTFFSVLELQEYANPAVTREISSLSSIEDMELIYQDDNVSGVHLQFIDGASMILFVSHNTSDNVSHKVNVNGEEYNWTGNYYLNIKEN